MKYTDNYPIENWQKFVLKQVGSKRFSEYLGLCNRSYGHKMLNGVMTTPSKYRKRINKILKQFDGRQVSVAEKFWRKVLDIGK